MLRLWVSHLAMLVMHVLDALSVALHSNLPCQWPEHWYLIVTSCQTGQTRVANVAPRKWQNAKEERRLLSSYCSGKHVRAFGKFRNGILSKVIVATLSPSYFSPFVWVPHIENRSWPSRYWGIHSGIPTTEEEGPFHDRNWVKAIIGLITCLLVCLVNQFELNGSWKVWFLNKLGKLF